jgi:hypothetical protein
MAFAFSLVHSDNQRDIDCTVDLKSCGNVAQMRVVLYFFGIGKDIILGRIHVN